MNCVKLFFSKKVKIIRTNSYLEEARTKQSNVFRYELLFMRWADDANIF